jgi:exonuclease SbcD
MRIVHTADWHAGRVWYGRNRLGETAAVLDHLAGYVEREQVDLLLMAGDVFDTPSPAAEAERLVFGFFRRVGRAGVPAVVIAGNHDSPVRLEAWGALAELAGVRAVGRPRLADNNGVLTVPTRRDETALVAALPFAPVRTWVTALELAGDETVARSRYAEMFKRAAARTAAGFRPDAVNVLMAHTHLDGAVLGASERRIHLGDDWAAAPQALPASAQYVALGHIHRPQKVEATGPQAYYAGSPLQLDFGEAGDRKVFYVVDVVPGRPPRSIEAIPYQGGKALADVRLTLAELERRQDELRAAGWLRVTVVLEEPDPELNRKVRNLLGEAAVSVRDELPQRPDAARPPLRADASPLELYRDFHRERHGPDPTEEVEQAFVELYDNALR